MEQAYRLARVRQDRAGLISAARRRVESERQGDGALTVMLERMHRALARHHVFVARDLNRRLIALTREPACACGSVGR
jgi:hypothetical protein